MRALGHSSRMTGAGARGPGLALGLGVLLVVGAVFGAHELARGSRSGTEHRALAVRGVEAPRLPDWQGRVERCVPGGQSRVAWLIPCDAGAPGAYGLRGVTGAPARQPPCLRFHGVGFDTWASFDGGPALAPAHGSWGAARGRGGCPPFPVFAVLRWSRARIEPADTAMARRVRYPVAPVSARSGLADQPPIVTRPLRGPPAFV